MDLAEGRAFIPSFAMSQGCRGIGRTGRSTSAASSVQRSAKGDIKRRQASASSPREEPASLRSCSSRTAVPSSNGCARAAGEWIHSRPYFAKDSEEKNGDPIASGCTADPKS